MIETKVDGSPASVRAAATFLGQTLKKQVGNAGDEAARARRLASGAWEGSASEAYRGFAAKVVQASDQQEHDQSKAEEKFRTYAGKLERLQERMSGRRATARDGGLTVSGTTIAAPPPANPPADLPADSTPQEATAWDARNAAFEKARDRVELYNKISDEVTDDLKTFQDWISANLDAFATVQDPPLSSYLLNQLKKSPATAALFAIDVNKRALDGTVEAYRSEAARLRSEADAARRGLRSGNPAVRSAAEGVDIAGDRQAARLLEEGARGGSRLARALPIVGTVLSIGLDVNDIAHGESPGRVIASEGANIAGGALGAAAVVGGAALIGVGAPVIAVAAGAAVVGVGAGMLAEYAWDHWVPEDVTSAIDDGLKDFGHGVADVASDAGDAVSDAWHDLTPW